MKAQRVSATAQGRAATRPTGRRERPAGRPRLALAPAAPSTHLLALQRQAGNAAVADLVRHGAHHRTQRSGASRAAVADQGHRAPAGTVTVQRHSSWEHQLIGDLTPNELSVLGAARDVDMSHPATKFTVGGGKQVSAQDVLHVLSQEVRRLSYFQRRPVAPVRAVGEAVLRRKDRQARQASMLDPQWQVRLVDVPMRGGETVQVTYGELNTLGDYFGSVDEMRNVDATWLERLVRGIRESTMKQLVNLYVEVKKLKDDSRFSRKRKSAEQKAMADIGLDTMKFRSQSGKDDALPIGGVMNELKLMGAGPVLLGGVLGKKKPVVGKAKSTTYGSTLARNACHFAPESWHAWAEHHKQARAKATAAVAKQRKYQHLRSTHSARKLAEADAVQLANEAMLINGFGDHYLQDSYAAGHLINKTQIMQWYVKWLDKHRGKWDAHFDKNWRMAQDMAYGQRGLAARRQFDKARVGQDRSIGGQAVPSARNPQTVENLQGADWKTRAKALGLRVPASLDLQSRGGRLFTAWQAKELKARRKHRPKTLKALEAIGATAGLTAAGTYYGVFDLFRDGIIRFAGYGVEDRAMSQGALSKKLLGGASLTLRDAYIPKAAPGNQQAVDEKALGVTYKEYLEFMNSSFLQKATNNLHDHFCKNGLDVYAGSSTVMKIYGDNNMLQAGASAGLQHSGETAKMSESAVADILGGAQPQHTLSDIVDRFPDAVVSATGAKLSLEAWHNAGELQQFCENQIFPQMSDVAAALPSKIAPGVFSKNLGKISEVHPGAAF